MNYRDSRENDYHKGTKLGKHEKTTEDTESTENKAMAVQNASENKYFHGSVPSVFSVVNLFVFSGFISVVILFLFQDFFTNDYSHNFRGSFANFG